MDTSQKSPVIISLCTGIRGLERGLERALQQKLRIAAYVEIETFIISNLIAGMEAGILAPVPVWTDLKTFPFGKFHGKVHGIIGGYPCQPFSVAGKQRGKEDPRHLWPFIKEGISSARPVFCFFENVRGHLKLGFEEVYNDLREFGYEVRFGIYSAEEVGAPHRRERLFILAILEDSCRQSIRNELGELHRDATRTSSAMDDTGHIRSKERQEQTAGIKQSSEGMANPYDEGLERRNSGELPERSGECLTGPCGTHKRWPARPGEQQYEWEEPRTTKSGLGITINGYNFREDLLRAAGNGVVEQTAELAFIDLLSKF